MSVIKVAVIGASGRMGREIIRLVSAHDEMTLGYALVGRDSACKGHDAGTLAGLPPLGVMVQDVDMLQGIERAQVDVLIDFSRPEGTAAVLEAAASRGFPTVVGTTAWEAHAALLDLAAAHAPVVAAANMAPGMVLAGMLAALAARLLPEADIEIMEMHHAGKRDAPSGTALALAERLLEVRGLPSDAWCSGRTAPRTPGIGIHAMRGGDVAGEHTVILAGPGERLELTHRAGSRVAFARGALLAARFVVEQPPGRYDMAHVLGWPGMTDAGAAGSKPAGDDL